MKQKAPTLTHDQRRQVEAVYAATLDTQRTAELLGVTRPQVRKQLQRAGIPPSGASGGACYRHIDEVRQWAAAGLSMSEIARRIGSTHHKVSAFLAKHQIPYIPYTPQMERNGRWRGGRIVDKDGYVLIKSPDHPARDRHNYVREHRLVMEQVLGRHLQPQEVVHHKDGDKQHNQADNLEVFGTNAEHLAETLRGQRPQWTADGWARMKAPRRRGADLQPAASPDPLTEDAAA